MSDPVHETPQEAAEEFVLPAEPETETGFKSLSQKILSRTTDLLGVSILAVGLLTVGGKLSRWWNTSPTEISAVPATSLPEVHAWGESGQGVTMDWGDTGQVFHHQEIAGDTASIAERLEKIALANLASASIPQGSPSDREMKLLSELAKVNPSEILSSGESLYRIGEGLPLLVITKPEEGTTKHRVMCWARAFPKSPARWLVVLIFASDSKTKSAVGKVSIPLPRGCKTIQRLHDANGRSWVSFRGAGPVAEWRRHFDIWFANQNESRLREWTLTESTWAAGYQIKQRNQQAEVWLHPHPKGDWEGLLILEPLSSSNN